MPGSIPAAIPEPRADYRDDPPEGDYADERLPRRGRSLPGRRGFPGFPRRRGPIPPTRRSRPAPPPSTRISRTRNAGAASSVPPTSPPAPFRRRPPGTRRLAGRSPQRWRAPRSQHRRDRRAGRGRRRGRHRDPVDVSSVTRCPTARTAPPRAAWAATRRSPSSPTRRSPIPCSSSPRATTPRPARSATTAWSVSVKPAGSDAVLNGFAGKWPAELGGQPALWIPGSSISAARLAAAAGQKTITDSRSLVTSPVMLAVRPELQTGAGQPELGGAARPADQPERVGRLELAGVGIAATGAADERQRRRRRTWPARRWRPRRYPPARRQPRASAPCARC